MHLFDKCRAFTRHNEVKAEGLYPYFLPVSGSTDTEVVINGKKKIMIGSNNYLGLTHHPHVVESAKRAIDRYGSGCTGSRFLNGNLDLHLELEERLARFIGTEAALVFSTGYQTNLGVISTLVGRQDTVYLDKLNHACIVDGARLSFGTVQRFNHNDLDALEAMLRSQESGGAMVIVDGVFSMEGEIADVPRLVALREEFDFALALDDAHSIGVLGHTGAGTAEHFGLTHKVDLTIGTFSKSFASIGGFVAGPRSVIDYLQHHARSLIFSASMPPSAVATVLAAMDVMEAEPERRDRLWAITKRMIEGFHSLGFETGKTETPIVPVIIGPMEEAFLMWKELFERGIYTNAVLPPAVPEGSCRLRTSYIATHTDDQLDYVLEQFAEVGKKLALV
jgi:8-amino-7-oxononanoate synthase